jgi:hypothetical protein
MVAMDLEALFAEADEVIQRSSELTERLKSERSGGRADESPLLTDLDSQVAHTSLARWHSVVIRGH